MDTKGFVLSDLWWVFCIASRKGFLKIEQLQRMGISLRFLAELVIWQVSQEVARAVCFGKRLLSLLSLWLQWHNVFPAPWTHYPEALLLLLLGSAWASNGPTLELAALAPSHLGEVSGRSHRSQPRSPQLQTLPANPVQGAVLPPLVSQSESGLQQNSFLQLKAVIFLLRQLPTSVQSQTCSNQ